MANKKSQKPGKKSQKQRYVTACGGIKPIAPLPKKKDK